jgi:outer membrane usher protein FimD/PapC
MQKIMKWFAPLLAVGVAIFIISFLVSINSQEPVVESKPLKLKSENIAPKQKEKIWLNHLSQTQKKGYFYPVNEIYVEVNLNEKITKTITYKLSAVLKDPYQLFCLKEELKRYGLKYFLKKDKQGIELLIYSQNVDKLRSLVQVLKNYKISAQIKPYKEEY